MNEVLVVSVRGIMSFFSLLILARILGKQQISQMTFFDYVASITIGSIAASMTVDVSIRAWPQFFGLFIWVGLVLLLQVVAMKWRWASKYVDGEPTVVVMNGQIMETALRRTRYRVSDLLEELRLQGVFDLSKVEFAVLETKGKISVLLKAQHQPVTPKDMNMSTDYEGITTELVYDGIVVDSNLDQVHLDRKWLEKELRKKGIHDPSEVFLATLDTSGNLYVDTYKDHVKSPVDMSDPIKPQEK
ncbi:MAG TPA: DUF421 domain-containing protein [Firmicutes bacterium]|nr:DUF421 domain-containing protein [Bacillota bacterium]